MPSILFRTVLFGGWAALVSDAHDFNARPSTMYDKPIYNAVMGTRNDQKALIGPAFHLPAHLGMGFQMID
jgi:hypothetical protein